MEIERKWITGDVSGILKGVPNDEIIQGYICTDPVVRVRRYGDEYFLTVKGKGMLAREEYEMPVTKEAFDRLIKKCEGIIIKKTRYRIPIGKTDTGDELTAEVDIFHGCHEGLKMVEVEFGSIDEAKAFVPPEWFLKEVTEDGRFSNSYLSEHRLSDIGIA